jgi:hypothetical protein
MSSHGATAWGNAMEDGAARSGVGRRARSPFQVESECRLRIHLNGLIWFKSASLVSWTGGIRFRKERLFEQGVRRTIRRLACGGSRLALASGEGEMCLADRNRRIHVVRIGRNPLWVGIGDVLAVEPEVRQDFSPWCRWAGIWSGGSLPIALQGDGFAVITTNYELIRLPGPSAVPDLPVPPANAKWSAGLKPEFQVDVGMHWRGDASRCFRHSAWRRNSPAKWSRRADVVCGSVQ